MGQTFQWVAGDAAANNHNPAASRCRAKVSSIHCLAQFNHRSSSRDAIGAGICGAARKVSRGEAAED